MPRTKKQSSEAAVREIRRRARRKFSPEEKIRIVLEGLRGEHDGRSVQLTTGIESGSNVDHRSSVSLVSQRPHLSESGPTVWVRECAERQREHPLRCRVA
jgi:transposase-like protein